VPAALSGRNAGPASRAALFFAKFDGTGNNGVMDVVHGRKPGEVLTTIVFG
jgi:hypothetical protein